MAKGNEKNLELKVLKLLKEGSINEEEAQKLLGKTKKPKNQVFRNFIIGALIVAAAGFATYKTFQSNITKRTEEELRQTIAEEIDEIGAGYFVMPKKTEGIDYDGKKYTMEFDHNKGTVVEKGREFILPMSVEKEGKISWYDLRVRDDKLVEMKRKSFIAGGGCSNQWYKQKLKRKERTRISREETELFKAIGKKTKQQSRAHTFEEKLAKERREKERKYTSEEVEKLLKERSTEVKRHYRDFNSDNKKDMAMLFTTWDKFEGKILYTLALVHSIEEKYKVDFTELILVNPNYKGRDTKLIFDKRILSNKFKEKLFKEHSWHLRKYHEPGSLKAVNYCISVIRYNEYNTEGDTVSFFYDTKRKNFYNFYYEFFN